MTGHTPNNDIQYSVLIETGPDIVWEMLTKPEYMKQWMGENEMDIEIETNWRVGQPIIIRGFHHAKFENRGTVLVYQPNQFLKYNHLSSISRLPDITENYTSIEFRLNQTGGHTSLTITLENFPTESIKQHLDFYWKTTLNIIKNQAEYHHISIIK